MNNIIAEMNENLQKDSAKIALKKINIYMYYMLSQLKKIKIFYKN